MSTRVDDHESCGVTQTYSSERTTAEANTKDELCDDNLVTSQHPKRSTFISLST
jgi:hypothetical protein